MAVSTWNFDYAHSAVNFVSRHMVVARVFGRFNRFSGTLKFDPENVSGGSVEVQIAADSIDTNNPERDRHVRSPEFLDAAAHPQLVFRSNRVEPTGGAGFRLHGDLTIRGITRPVVLESRSLGVVTDPWGQKRALFSAKGFVNRTEYGITWNKALANGGWLVSEKVELEIDVQATEVK